MKVKFNKYERIAGLFVITACLGGLLILAGVAIKQGWFETKVAFGTTLENAEGLRVGTPVQISGLRAGVVVQVELRSNDQVHVIFEISEKYHDLIRENTVVRTVRPFIISEKVLDVSIGDKSLKQLAKGSEIKSEVTYDIMDLVSGRTLAPHLQNIGKMMENLRQVAEALLNPERSKDFIKMFDQLVPLMDNMAGMSKEMNTFMKAANKDQKALIAVQNFVKMSAELNKILPVISQMAPELAEKSPQLAGDMAKIASNLAVMTDELQAIMPAMRETFNAVGPELPRASRRAMEALDETVVTLKALQKSFLLRSNAREVREEEAKMNERLPASGTPAEKEKESESQESNSGALSP